MRITVRLAISFVAISVASVLFSTSTAQAACGWGDKGFVYHWASCFDTDARCANAFPDKDSVLFVSDVVYDDGSDGSYTDTAFFDAMNIQVGFGLMAKGGYCYETKTAAVDDRRHFLSRDRSDKTVHIYTDEWD